MLLDPVFCGTMLWFAAPVFLVMCFAPDVRLKALEGMRELLDEPELDTDAFEVTGTLHGVRVRASYVQDGGAPRRARPRPALRGGRGPTRSAPVRHPRG